MKNKVSNTRMSSASLFSGIVKENHKKMTILNAQIDKLEKNRTKVKSADETILFEQEIIPLRKKLAKSSLIVIIFSAIAVETYIYDYASRHLGDVFVKDHLDKLDAASKWVIVPKLITGRELPRGERWFELLKNLIKARNSIVHHKSSELPMFPMDVQQYLKKQQASSRFLQETARQSTRLLGILADKISEIDPEETPWVKLYLT
jgi:hypothetical protein